MGAWLNGRWLILKMMRIKLWYFPEKIGGADTQQRSTLNPILLEPTNLDLEAG